MTDQRPSRWLNLVKALALVVTLLGLLAFAAEKVLTHSPRNPATVAEIKSEIVRAIPARSTRTQVENWLKSRGFVFSDASLKNDDAITAILHDTDRSLLIHGAIQARFSFDKDGRLGTHSIEWVGTGP
jgi:uncharacterized protein YbcI